MIYSKISKQDSDKNMYTPEKVLVKNKIGNKCCEKSKSTN